VAENEQKNKPLEENLKDEAIAQLIEKTKRSASRSNNAPAEKQSSSNNARIDSPPKTNTPAKESSSPIKPLRTFESDLAETIDQKKSSVLSVNLAEKKRREERGQSSEEKESQGTFLITIISIILIVGGVGILSTLFFFRNKTEVAPAPVFETIIAYDNQEKIATESLNRGSLIEGVRTYLKESTPPLNSITNVSFTIQKGESRVVISAQRFLAILESRTPEIFLHSLGSDFMYGIHSFNGNEAFLILKTKSYENAFAGMLGWEKTLVSDLGPLFAKASLLPESTTTPAFSEVPDGIRFSDVIVKNKDTRAIREPGGRIVFLYGFTDNETIVFASSEETFAELLKRFASSKLIR